MPRSRFAGPTPAQQAAPDYFSSLPQLQAYFDAPLAKSTRAAPLPPFSPARSPGQDEQRGKLLVCHDYTGGYCEREDERGYTLQNWELVDTFVYFSHHRVSCPPPSWIRAAHTHGTRILGTLIFEWDAGREDIVELVAPAPSASSSLSSSTPSSSSSSTPVENPFKHLSTRYADYLVSLAQERGFAGWLVNVEVELGIGKKGEEKKWAKEHAQALVEWVRYLRDEMRRKVEGSEVMWYDAVTTEGKLAWQNRISDANLPFFAAADSVFLNYWWRPDEVNATAFVVDQMRSKRREDVYFGIDIFGRGSYGGGGFETWRAMRAVQSAPFRASASSDPTSTASSPSSESSPSSFSTALFAPGWTVEAESLKQSLASPSAYARWLADDTYLWSHGAPTPSVAIEAARLTAERKERRGVERARLLAAGLAPSASPLPIPFRQPPPFDYNALEPLPGGGPPRPISAFLPSPRPIPCPSSSFYTNFAAGSGHAFFVEGVKVLDDSDGAGWTDVGFAFPQPSLVFHPSLAEARKKHGVEARMVEDDAWEGPRALRIDVASRGEPSEVVHIPLCPIELPLMLGVASVEITAVWKLLDGRRTDVVSADLQLASSASGSSSSAVFSSGSTTSGYPVANGWRKSTQSISIKVPADTTRPSSSIVLDYTLSLPAGASVLVGSLSVVPSPPRSSSYRLGQPHISHLSYTPSAEALRWDVDFALASSSSDGLEPSPPFASPSTPSPPPPPPSFFFFHLFLEHASAYSMPKTVYLGTTFDREFPLNRERLNSAAEGRTAKVVVRGVRADGAAGTKEDGGEASFEVDAEQLA